MVKHFKVLLKVLFPLDVTLETIFLENRHENFPFFLFLFLILIIAKTWIEKSKKNSKGYQSLVSLA